MAEPEIRYVRTSDGVNIAYAVMGEGLPLVFASNVMGDLHWYTHNEGTRREIDTLIASGCQVVRYDLRGMGCSEREVGDLSVHSRVLDLEAVVDDVGLQRFALCGYTHGCAAAVTYAANHPHRISHLVLVNPYPSGTAYYETVPAAGAMIELYALAERDWEFFTLTLASAMSRHADPEAAKRTAALFRAAVAPTTYITFARAARESVILDQLPRIRIPTLVLVDESPSSHPDLGKAVASAIPGARLAMTTDYIPNMLSFLGLDELPVVQPRPIVTPRSVSATAVILFVDIADSTALTERWGDVGFRERSRELDAALRAVVRDNGGSVVDAKTLGDGILATFSAASQAIGAAVESQIRANEFDLPLHTGLHAGDVIHEEQNIFGGAVNIASRICGLSAPGEILVTDIVRGLARTSSAVKFEDRGMQELKGIGDPVRVFAIAT
jgi:class 3 adenylate cyclase